RPERPDHPGRDHRLRGPLVHLHHEDAAGRRPDQGGATDREGVRGAEPREGRAPDEGPAPLDRGSEDGRPERARRRPGDARDRRHGALDGRGGGEVVPKHGKIYRAARAAIDREKLYSPVEAVKMLKNFNGVKFDETVEAHFRLGLNVRHADQQLRGTLMLPHGTGKSVRVAVFAEGDKAREAEEAGAASARAAARAANIEGGFPDFAAAIATPDPMANLGKPGRVPAPRA